MARDLTWGPVQANDGRRAYIPEAGQRDYPIPAVWADLLEDKVELRVKATVGEWANILMMPFYHTLATYHPLTSKFRSAYVGVVHDVMLRRLKKAAYKYAQEIERRVDELSAEEEEEEPPLPSAPRFASKPIKKMSEQHTASSPEADVFREYKKIKTLVRERRSVESNEDYIKDVWPMINNATESDEAKKLWLSHVTAHPLDKQGTAESHYRRLVLEDMDDEDSLIKRAKVRMDSEVGKEPYLEDTGAEVSMTRRGLKTTGYLTVQFAKGTAEEMPYGTWQGIIWVKGPYNLITITYLKELNKPFGERRSLSQRLSQLQSRLVKVGPTQSGTGAQEWYKAVDVPEVTEQKLKESDFSPAGKEKLRKIITSANVARFKNDCGDLGLKYVHLIEGGVHPPVRQYP
ncbi:hypothetical protein XENOCAPTIV_017567 [Xenoophorus captivus]|uniref:Uncharacterized protein n=1 Tax=Xenoophorus captivus TaxID=1517983 RepID=A0ABV0RHT7_9TELE